MTISKRTKDAIWNKAFAREDDYYNTLLEISLISKKIKNPSVLQLQLEKLFIEHIYPKNLMFLVDFSELELGCLILAAWGYEIGETAEILEVKDDSVNKFRAKIANKLQAKNITQSVYKASQAGILKLNNIDFLLNPKKENSFPKMNKTNEPENILT